MKQYQRITIKSWPTYVVNSMNIFSIKNMSRVCKFNCRNGYKLLTEPCNMKTVCGTEKFAKQNNSECHGLMYSLRRICGKWTQLLSKLSDLSFHDVDEALALVSYLSVVTFIFDYKILSLFWGNDLKFTFDDWNYFNWKQL